MIIENQAAETVVKLDPTLNSIQQERDEAAARAAELQAKREEEARIREKRRLIGEVLNMQADIETRYEAVKKQKKLLKGLRLDLAAISDDPTLTAEELVDLLSRGQEAYTVGGPDAFACLASTAGVIASALAARNSQIFAVQI
jgi:hypothetical protein